MKPMRSIFVATVLVAAPLFAWADPIGTIPEPFLGEWAAELKYCGDRESGRSFEIQPNGIAYFEAGDTVVEMQELEPGSIHIAVDHQDGEGMERLYRTLILSDDRQTLTFYYGDGPEDVSRRCPHEGRQVG